MDKLIIGSHVSYKTDEGLIGSVKEAISYGETTFMFYTGAPQNTNRSPIDKDKTEKAIELMKENNIDLKNVVVHAPYIINPANYNNRDFCISFLKQEIKRVEEFGVTKLVLHPGSHVGAGIEEGIKNIISVLNETLDASTNVDVCLETMAGKGSELGTSFEQLKQIIDGVKYNDKLKVCLDTCHISDAGYDLNDFDQVLNEFDNIIGLQKLACIHVNDSKNIKGSHKDRHENIGLGTIGFSNLLNVIYNEKLVNIPKILETPYVTDIDTNKRAYPPFKFEINMIKEKKMNYDLVEDVRNYYN